MDDKQNKTCLDCIHYGNCYLSRKRGVDNIEPCDDLECCPWDKDPAPTDSDK